MKEDLIRFSKKTLVFILMVIIGSNGMLMINHLFAKKQYYTNADISWVKALEGSPKMLIMGSSTSRYLLNPQLIQPLTRYNENEIINISYNANTPIRNYYAYMKIEKDLPNLETVIYTLDPWVFSTFYYRHDQGLKVTWDWKERLYIFRNVSKTDAILGSSIVKVAGRMIDENFRSLISEVKPTKISEGLGSRKLEPNLVDERFNEPVHDWLMPTHFGLSSIQFEYLQNLKAVLEDRQVEVIFFIPPNRSTWHEDYANCCELFDQEFVSNLNLFLGPSKVIGSYSAIPKELEDSLFNDPVHVNQAGQAYFSERFTTAIDSLGKVSIAPFQATTSY